MKYTIIECPIGSIDRISYTEGLRVTGELSFSSAWVIEDSEYFARTEDFNYIQIKPFDVEVIVHEEPDGRHEKSPEIIYRKTIKNIVFDFNVSIMLGGKVRVCSNHPYTFYML